jgi:hypothetical protein
VASQPRSGHGSVAIRERGVAVGGDVIGSVIVTGDNANVKLILGSEHGALLEQLIRAERPTRRLRAVPLRNLPEQPADAVDRDAEVRAIVDSAGGSQGAINVYGEEGIGKTYALLRALNAEDSPIAAKSVYVYAAGHLEDVLQSVFEAFYECIPPSKSPAAELRRDLGEVSALVLLDSVDLPRDAAQQLFMALRRCGVVVVSRERVVWQGPSLSIGGLEPQFALTVVENELGRALAFPERGSAERLCAALRGHPLRIREAVAAARPDRRSLVDIATTATAEIAPQAPERTELGDAPGDERRLLAALALFDGNSIGHEHLRALVDSPDFDNLIKRALESRAIRANSPRYRLGVTTAQAARSVDLSAAGDQALAYFVAWAHATRGQPELELTEGPAVLALLHWAVENGRLKWAVELGREIDSAFAIGRRFGAWGELLELVLSAGRGCGDRGAEAWALHQLGTRAVALGQLATGIALLTEALALRREIDHRAGASATEENLAIARRLRRRRRLVWRHPFLLAIVVALLVAGTVTVAIALPGAHKHHPAHHAPVANTVSLAPVGDQTSTVKSAVSVSITATDSGQATLSFDATPLPPGLEINHQTGQITGNPTTPGTFPVTVTATDSTGAHDSKPFTWTIKNTSPVANSPG